MKEVLVDIGDIQKIWEEGKMIFPNNNLGRMGGNNSSY